MVQIGKPRFVSGYAPEGFRRASIAIFVGDDGAAQTVKGAFVRGLFAVHLTFGSSFADYTVTHIPTGLYAHHVYVENGEPDASESWALRLCELLADDPATNAVSPDVARVKAHIAQVRAEVEAVRKAAEDVEAHRVTVFAEFSKAEDRILAMADTSYKKYGYMPFFVRINRALGEEAKEFQRGYYLTLLDGATGVNAAGDHFGRTGAEEYRFGDPSAAVEWAVDVRDRRGRVTPLVNRLFSTLAR